jgi:hypothetical protein
VAKKSFTTSKGRKAGGVPFTKTTLHNLLTNPIYTGKVRLRDQIYAGEHPRILDERTWKKVQRRLSRDGRRGKRHIADQCGALLKGIAYCASCDVAMVHTYAQSKGKPLYRYYVCGRAHRLGWSECETRSVSALALENAVIEQLGAMAAEVSPLEPNEVAAALFRGGFLWEGMSEPERERFIRALVREIRYDGRSGRVTLRFDSEAFRETEDYAEADSGEIPE